MTFRLKCCLLYSSHIVTSYSQSFCMSSINDSKKTSVSLPACLGPDMRVANKRYFHLWHNYGRRLNMHIIIDHVLCGFFLSEWIHSIRAKSKPDVSWIIREVLLMSKIKIFPLSTNCRVLNLSIHLKIHIPKQ
jgi:hypothetical protein